MRCLHCRTAIHHPGWPLCTAGPLGGGSALLLSLLYAHHGPLAAAGTMSCYTAEQSNDWGSAMQAQQHARQVAAENAALAKEVGGMRQSLLQLQAAHVKPTMDSTLRVSLGSAA